MPGFVGRIKRVQQDAYNRAVSDPYGRQGLVRTENRAMDRARRTGTQAEDAYLRDAMDFHAQEGLNDYARGAYGSIADELGRELDRLRGSAVGAGRLDTGFYDKDQGEVVKAGERNLTNAIAQQALAAQAQQLQNDQGLASYGEYATTQANDLLTARRQELENAYREEQERKRKSGLGGFVKGVVGGIANYALPGIGGAIGDYLGSKI